MMHTLNRTQQRWLALALLAMVVGGVLAITALPVWLASRSNNATITDLENRIAHFRRAATISASLRPKYEQLGRWHDTNTQYLKSSSIELAAAELQRLVKRHAVATGTEIISTQMLTGVRDEQIPRVALKVRMSGEMESIIRLFHELETGEPYLFLDNITIKSTGSTRSRRVANTGIRLDVDLEIAGYMPGAI